ncbi:dihydroxyacetone kinase subunit L [Rhodobacteraceae bacterium R_SAG2]|nr:dihydroxyacetone kinase subunit L [Rhodobacteraceae bacterium R_SAG2]
MTVTSTPITAQSLADYVKGTAERARAEEQHLNSADAKLGDGDTGSMLVRVLKAMADSEAGGANSLSEAARRMALAAMRETGSSLGTLVATAAMTLAKEAQAREARDALLMDADLPYLLAEIGKALSARGKSELGDKTILDSIAAVQQGLRNAVITRDTARAAAQNALTRFHGKPCRIGRARMFPEKSRDLDDPGMLAVSILI